MKKEESCIEVLERSHPDVEQHLLSLGIGYHKTSLPPSYRHRETGETFSHITGGIGWPGRDLSGYVLIIGIGHDRGSPVFTCLDERENNTVQGLLEDCLSLRARYGLRQSDELLRYWYGNSRRFASLVTHFNTVLMRGTPKEDGVYLINPVDSHRPNHFELYLYRIQELLTPRSARKSLLLGPCSRLRNHLQNLPPDAASHSGDEYPAVYSLGGMVHSMVATRPWERRSDLRDEVSADTEHYESHALREGRDDPFPHAVYLDLD